ncbi:MAG: ATP phosphoribosyltransferase [Alphaproteobacteria bacterium]|nr:ATP phosphoribosyltransferase [Alphaproteobacteria bacterium]
MNDQPIIIALPKGRILEELKPVLQKVGITPEPDFENGASRKLKFDTNVPGLSIIRVRSFDVATFVAFGAAQIGVAGNDVLMEFDYNEIYAPLDLKIGKCRLSLCQPKDDAPIETRKLSHMKIATKFPNFTKSFFAEKGIQAECIELNGAMELAPLLGLAPTMVDLVASGSTLKANNLAEIEVMAEVSSRLIVNRAAYKTQGNQLKQWIDKFREAVEGL